jgi:O-antigen/teichoic acid export membrane protein
VAVSSLVLRDAIASVIGVRSAWAAAVAAPAACLWLLVCVQRGAFQGLRRRRSLGASLGGEAALRVGLGVAFVAAGLGVAGALVGVLVALVVVTAVQSVVVMRAMPAVGTAAAPPRLASNLGRAFLPLLVLSLAAILQNVDVIVAQHRLPPATAGSYAAAAFIAKACVWLAVGLSLFLIPRARRRSALALPALVSAAAALLVAHTLLGGPLVALAYGSAVPHAAHALPWIGLATAFAVIGYLGVQYLLGRGRPGSVWALAAVVIAEPFALQFGSADTAGVAHVLAAVQLALLVVIGLSVTLSRRAKPAPVRIAPTAAPASESAP